MAHTNGTAATVAAATPAPDAYIVALTPPEREQLLVALELAIATKRREREAFVLLADVDAELADRLCDALFLATAAA